MRWCTFCVCSCALLPPCPLRDLPCCRWVTLFATLRCVAGVPIPMPFCSPLLNVGAVCPVVDLRLVLPLIACRRYDCVVLVPLRVALRVARCFVTAVQPCCRYCVIVMPLCTVVQRIPIGRLFCCFDLPIVYCCLFNCSRFVKIYYFDLVPHTYVDCMALSCAVLRCCCWCWVRCARYAFERVGGVYPRLCDACVTVPPYARCHYGANTFITFVPCRCHADCCGCGATILLLPLLMVVRTVCQRRVIAPITLVATRFAVITVVACCAFDWTFCGTVVLTFAAVDCCCRLRDYCRYFTFWCGCCFVVVACMVLCALR
ncbi:hypothetical protein AVEN_64033-1 [Araneus ventricosus]|uniref:Uncharacterized protein n=1 Tax=Araneus ventricosus TaxID=182803 RepID=A0A4Y2WHZ6_ARAVE|nr:hypothetical protein AVEN_64033-1 [Araneus ventricosus]